MKTFYRLCIETRTVADGDRTFTVERGREYITSDEKDGKVTVFSTYWVQMPVSLFHGAEVFTK